MDCLLGGDVEGNIEIEMELNPNHPVTSRMSDQWHKIVALLLMRTNSHTEIPLDEVERFANSGLGAVVIRTEADTIILDLVSWEEAKRLAKQEGGLPH